MLKQCLKIMGIALIMCLIPSIAYAEDGKTVSYQGLTFFCETGSIENKVSLEGTKNKEIFINQGGEYTITGTWDVTAAGWDAYTFPNAVLTIETKENVTIILDNVSITAPNIDLQSRQIAGILCGDNSNVHIVLKGENKIDCSTYYNNSHSTGSAGIGTGTDANLVISGSGTLTAKGGQNHPAIGAIFSKQNANITINGGTVHAIGGSQGAGIGCYGGTSGSIGKILIEETNGEKIFITAEGGKNSGAGIGAGYETGFSEIRIESGTVRASSTNVSRSWSSGAGIGGSGNDSFAVRLGKIIINGGVVEATGTAYGAGIGGGSGQLADVEITGGKITAVGKWYGAGIGGGDGSKGTANLNIKDADVVAVSRFAEGIGAGSNGIAPGIELSNMSDLRVFSGQQLAINEGAVVTDCSILNTQFNEPLPYSVNLLQGFADAIMLQSIPADMKSFAYAFGEGGKKYKYNMGVRQKNMHVIQMVGINLIFNY